MKRQEKGDLGRKRHIPEGKWMEFHLLEVFPLDVGWAGAVRDWDSSHRTGGFSPHIQGDWLAGFPWEGGLENPGKGAWKTPGKGAWKSKLGSLNPFVFLAEKELWSRDFFGSRDHFPNNPGFGAGFGVGSVALSPFSWFSKLENHGIKSLFPPLLRKGAFSLKNQTLGASRPAGRAGIPGVNRELLSLGCDGSRARLQVGNRAWIEPGWGRGRDGAGSRGFPGCSRRSGRGWAAGLGWECGSLGWKRDPLGLTSGELKINPD